MDKQELPNPLRQPMRRHTIDTNTESMTPRYDFVLPSYSRDRRVSSIITTIPPAAIITDGSTSVNISIPEQNASPLETVDNKEGTNNELFRIFLKYLFVKCKSF
jgi:hypothetical protein